MSELLDDKPRVRARTSQRPLARGPARPVPGQAPPALVLPGATPAPRWAAPEAAARVGPWLRAHLADLALVAGLLALAGVLVGTGIGRYPGYGDDEGTYVAEAWAVITHGQLSHYTYWYDHPPLGWIQLGILTWLFGGLAKGATAVATARHLMLAPALATTGLLYALARRLRLRRAFAVLAVALLILSPLGLRSLREVYLENFAMPWVLAAFIFAVSPSRRLWAFAASGACFAIAVLSKETMLLYLPGLALAVAQTTDRRTRTFCLSAFGVAFVLIGLGYPLYALLKGELLPGHGHVSLEQAIVWQLSGRQGSGSIFGVHSQARSVIDNWLSVDPWLLGLGLGSVPLALFVRRLRPIAVALAVAILVAIHGGGYLPEPFDIGLLPLCALLPAGLLDATWGRWPGMRSRRALLRPAAVVVALAAFGVAAGSAWEKGDSVAMSADQTRPVAQAEHWIEAHVNRHARLLVDDTMYVDLVRSGFRPRYGVVWFYKLGFTNNLDPAVVRHLPQGWRDFDYVVLSPIMRSALDNTPRASGEVGLAIRHSVPVVSFGPVGETIQIRRVRAAPGQGTGG
jgi:hypothetical protein